MKNLTLREYNKLKDIQIKAYKFAQSRKNWNDESVRLDKYRAKFQKLAEELGILSHDGETVKYISTEANVDYSHSYNFGDVIA